MDRKSAPFAAGVSLGLVLAVLAVLALREGTPPAYAQATATGSVGNMAMVSMMSTQNTADMVAVLSLDERGQKHLTLYQCPQGRTLKLIAARNITWDLQIPNAIKNDSPTVLEIKKEIEEYLKKEEEKINKAAGGSEKAPK